ncbi:MAG: replication-associated recombination protein A [Patescibacteria group bacterium]
MEPLASRIRPKKLDEFVGQSHLVGPGKPLRVAIEKGHIFSFILWGPPGVGKTTLAKIYAKSLGADLHELSAVSAGKDDIREIVGGGSAFAKASARQAQLMTQILFLDEIHRFNKAQQDFLLPYVERGELILIGATTENPSFEIISALLSRCRVFVLNSLSPDEMKQIITQTNIKIPAEARDWLIQMADGDARQAITVLENTLSLYKKITVETLKDTIQNKFLRFDKKGEEHYNTISAYIKSMRASQPDAALYYLARMIESGESPTFIARRMVIFASEDIGMAHPTALVVANEVMAAVDAVGFPEAAINLAHGTIYMATAPKDRAVVDSLGLAMSDVKEHGNLPIPMSIRNAPTKLMKNLGYGAGYKKYTSEDLLPEKIKGKKYYKPKQ